MEPIINKIKQLVAKHLRDVAPEMNKDEPAVARPSVVKKKGARYSSRQKFHATDVSEAAKPKKGDKEDGKVLVDPDEKEIGNTELKQTEESLSVRYKKHIEEQKMSKSSGRVRYVGVSAQDK